MQTAPKRIRNTSGQNLCHNGISKGCNPFAQAWAESPFQIIAKRYRFFTICLSQNNIRQRKQQLPVGMLLPEQIEQSKQQHRFAVRMPQARGQLR